MVAAGIFLVDRGNDRSGSASEDDSGEVVRLFNLALPTDNDALFHEDRSLFYMYVDRNFNGTRSRPWEAGQFGFVRNPRSTRDGLIYTRFHGGIDIQPTARDAAGRPLDLVRTISEGTVTYVNQVPGNSTYGKYVVVEHQWENSPFYSLYAHLNDVHVKAGEEVTAGDVLGLMGYTGNGINRRRAHLHLEINLLLSEHFEEWYRTAGYTSRNNHGIFNGINMTGIDVSRLYFAMDEDPALSIVDFISHEVPFFHVLVPNEGNLNLLTRYPWLLEDADLTAGTSWQISFNNYGLPVRITASQQEVTRPVLVDVERSDRSYNDLTRGLISGSGDRFSLTDRGVRYIRLITMQGSDSTS